MGGRFRVGVAMGGGAARALAHIGILEGLIEHGIPVDVISGTSMGAIIGAMYALEPDVGALKERIFAYLESDEFRDSKFDFMKDKDVVEGEGVFFRFSQFARRSLFYTLSMTRKAFISGETAQRNFDFLIEDVDIEETRIPFCATSVDLISGQEYVLDRGSLRQAIAATCAIPGILNPVEMDGRLLVDGGWLDAVPIEPAFALGADFVIGVDVGREIREPEPLSNALDIVFRSDSITRDALNKEQLKMADVVLTPATGKIHWADFSQAVESIEMGREEVHARIGEIKRRIRGKRAKSFLWGWRKNVSMNLPAANDKLRGIRP